MSLVIWISPYKEKTTFFKGGSLGEGTVTSKGIKNHIKRVVVTTLL